VGGYESSVNVLKEKKNLFLMFNVADGINPQYYDLNIRTHDVPCSLLEAYLLVLPIGDSPRRRRRFI
jgi:hypothetical protein